MTSIDATHDGSTHHDQERPSYDDINTPVIVLVGVISAIVTLLTIMFVQGMYYNWQNSYLREVTVKPVSIPSNAEIARQKSVLEGGDGVISIEQAMEKFIKKYGK